MSTICDDLRAAILQAAMQGSLTDSNGESWNESKIEDVCELCTGNSISENVKKAKYIKVVEGRNYIGTKDLLFNHSFNYENGVKIPFDETSFRIANRGDILLCIEGGSAGKKIGILEEDVNYGNKLCRFSPNDKLNNRFLYFYIQSPLFQEQFSGSMTGIIGGVSIKKIKAITIKYPDIAEQKRIVEKVDELMNRVADLEQSSDALASLKKAFPDDIKASLLQAAMQGKLTKQLSEDGNAEDLLEEITISESIGARKVKKKTIESDSYEESLFEIPSSWKWVKLGSVCIIARGGSPRPIKDFLTESVDGINWIKIGDTDKGGKYIWSTKERIKKEGLAKSRMIHAGDFLLTNSMSFGRPYISKIDGCIHDGWLVISQSKPIFDENYLFYVLSSRFMYYQFCGKVSGAVVKNLNSDKVANSVVPLPPLAEQKRIVERLEKLMQNINAVGDLIASE